MIQAPHTRAPDSPYMLSLYILWFFKSIFIILTIKIINNLFLSNQKARFILNSSSPLPTQNWPMKTQLFALLWPITFVCHTKVLIFVLCMSKVYNFELKYKVSLKSEGNKRTKMKSKTSQIFCNFPAKITNPYFPLCPSFLYWWQLNFTFMDMILSEPSLVST